MKRLLERAESEIEVKKSRFIAIALVCHSSEEIKPLLSAIRKEHPNATHVVHAAVLGPEGTILSSSDDKEPKNTAGRPALEVLKGSGVTDILVAIVRYFGGTLLGTGGLVKAYQDAAKAVLIEVKTEELITRKSFQLKLGYESYTPVKRALTELAAVNLKEDFGTGIVIDGMIAEKVLPLLKSRIEDIGQGRIQILFS